MERVRRRLHHITASVLPVYLESAPPHHAPPCTAGRWVALSGSTVVAVGECDADVFDEGLEKRTELYPAVFTHQLGEPLGEFEPLARPTESLLLAPMAAVPPQPLPGFSVPMASEGDRGKPRAVTTVFDTGTPAAELHMRSMTWDAFTASGSRKASAYIHRPHEARALARCACDDGAASSRCPMWIRVEGVGVLHERQAFRVHDHYAAMGPGVLNRWNLGALVDTTGRHYVASPAALEAALRDVDGAAAAVAAMGLGGGAGGGGGGGGGTTAAAAEATAAAESREERTDA